MLRPESRTTQKSRMMRFSMPFVGTLEIRMERSKDISLSREEKPLYRNED
jgi:hypothetical protein